MGNLDNHTVALRRCAAFAMVCVVARGAAGGMGIQRAVGRAELEPEQDGPPLARRPNVKGCPDWLPVSLHGECARVVPVGGAPHVPHSRVRTMCIARAHDGVWTHGGDAPSVAT